MTMLIWVRDTAHEALHVMLSLIVQDVQNV